MFGSTKSLALETGRKGITENFVAADYTDTHVVAHPQDRVTWVTFTPGIDDNDGSKR